MCSNKKLEGDERDMGKTVKFGEKDAALVKRIEAYRKKKGLSFIGAIRELCEIALTVESTVKKLK